MCLRPSQEGWCQMANAGLVCGQARVWRLEVRAAIAVLRVEEKIERTLGNSHVEDHSGEASHVVAIGTVATENLHLAGDQAKNVRERWRSDQSLTSLTR